MRKPKLNRARETRIADEIIVDACGPEEQAMGWYYYLEEKLEFPFKARCVDIRSVSLLKKGEEVEVLAMAREDDCMREMFVLTRFAGRRLGVPLSQLEVLEAGPETHEAVQDWRYWVAMGYEF
ncbi:MAG: calcium-binding protein [Betaproteobacteria bacterium RIFCSPLOWO2_12_FULL_62_58]|nr:MAG: calcium-binding protein [Betaproteobacteria bacterium RIFCSPLOWO2_12_FULL_62_58]